MKITLPTLNDTPHLFAKNYAAAVEKDSGGRIKTEVYPASQLGSIPRQIEGTQFGAIQARRFRLNFLSASTSASRCMAAPGLINSMEHGQRLAADPAVLKLMLGLGANKGLHGVGFIMATAVLPHLANADPPPRRFQRQEDPGLRLAVPDAWRSSGLA